VANELNFQKLRNKLVLFSLAYMLVASLLVSAVSILPLFNSLKKNTENSLLNLVEARAMAVEENLSGITEISQQIASRTTLRNSLDEYTRGEMDKEALTRSTTSSLADSLRQSEETVGITRLDRAGEIIAQIGIPIPKDLWLIPEPKSKKVLISDPQVIDNDLYLIAGAPIFNERSERIGTDILLCVTRQLHAILQSCYGLGKTGECVLGKTDKDDLQTFFLMGKEEWELYKGDKKFFPYRLALEKNLTKKPGIMRFEGDADWPATVLAFSPIKGTEWGLVVTMSQKELYSQVNRQLYSVAGTVLILTIFGGIGMFLLLRPLAGRVLVYSSEMETLNRELQLEIADRERAEENLRRSEHELSETFEAITDPVAILDVHGNILKMNQAAASLVKMPPVDQEKGKYCQFFMKLEKQHESCPFEKVLKTKKAEFSEAYKEDMDRYFLISAYPLLNENCDLWGAVHIAKDITEQRKMEHLKDELLSAVSHEMRTPLTAMLGFIEFLMENEVDRDMEMDYLATVHKETEKLNELIGNFLDLQRLQAEMEIYSFEAVDVRNLLQEAAYLFAKASKKHQIAVDCPPELPPVRGDFGRLQQVLKNLISNAIKYSPQGGKITLGARREEENILFWVKDEGMGIPQEALEKIFDRFYRENESARRIPGGVGLGLTLVREIVKAHQGRVWAASKPGKGSTFYIRLPLMKKA